MKVEIEVSIGELYDKITILRIKKERITDADKLHNIKKELQYLENKVLNNDPIVENLTKELFEVNSKLWDTEFGVVKPDVVGAVGSVKLIKISPFDSSEFRIPSLSLSRSTSSGILSLSKSGRTVMLITHEVSFSPHAKDGVEAIDLIW